MAAAYKFDIDLSGLTNAGKAVDGLHDATQNVMKDFEGIAAGIDKSLGPLNKLKSTAGKLNQSFEKVKANLTGIRDGLGKIFSIMRAISLSPMQKLFDAFGQSLSYSDGTMEHRRSAAELRTTDKNLAAIDRASNLSGVGIGADNLKQLVQGLTDVEKWGSFAKFGITDMQGLAKMDGVEASLKVIPQMLEKIEAAGGFESINARALYGKDIQEILGISFDQFRGASSRLGSFEKEYRNQQVTRDYGIFEQNERQMKSLEYRMVDLWDSILNKIMPSLNKLAGGFEKAAKALTDKIVKSGALDKFAKWLESISGDLGENMFNGFIKSIEWASKTLFETFKWLSNLLAKIPGNNRFKELAGQFNVATGAVNESVANWEGSGQAFKIKNLEKELNNLFEDAALGVAKNEVAIRDLIGKAQQSGTVNVILEPRMQGNKLLLNMRSYDSKTNTADMIQQSVVIGEVRQ